MTVHMFGDEQPKVDLKDGDLSQKSSQDASPDANHAQSSHETTTDSPTSSTNQPNCTHADNDRNEQMNSSHLESDSPKSANDILLNNPPSNDGDGQAHFECVFPEQLLNIVEDAISKPRWALNVIPCQEFEALLNISLEIISNGQIDCSKPCQHFVTETVLNFFHKFYNDDIIDNIKSEVIKLMIGYSFKIVELIVLCWQRENLKLLDLLAVMFLPSSRFASMIREDAIQHGDFTYAKESDPRFQRILLADLINHFGFYGGFQTFLSCFNQENISVHLIFSCLKPFISCIDLLTQQTIQEYFAPILQTVPKYIENLTNSDLKKEVKNELKSDNLSTIIRFMRNISMRLPTFADCAQSLEFLRLKVILRLLQVSSFNGKMNALNELNKVITCYSNESSTMLNLDEVPLSSEQMAHWLIENKVFEIILKDCLHQPQYVEKLENIIRFLIKKDALSFEDLDKIWHSQIGKHEIIVKNVHDLMAKLAWSFSAEQLNHLFMSFESSWVNASKKEREKLLELMRRLAEDDKDGSMAHKVLTLLWDIAYSGEVDLEIVDQALTAHFKILDYGRTYDKDSQKIAWLKKCIVQLEDFSCGNTVLPAMKHIREICRTFPSLTMASNKVKSYGKQKCKVTNRHEVLTILQEQYSFVALIANNLSHYMEHVRNTVVNEKNSFSPNVIYPGRRFTHVQEVQERLNFLKFVLQDGQLWLCLSQACEIWDCLARKAVFPVDIQICFRWFTSLIDNNNETDLDPETFGQFFELNILKLEPSLANIDGVECFQKFFITVNCQKSKIILRNRYYMDDSDLIGLDYLWKLILFCDDDAAQRAINLLIDVNTNLGPNLLNSQVDLHIDLIGTCFDRLKASYDTILIIEKDPSQKSVVNMELRKMTRVLSFLHDYIFKCDSDFSQERTILPMSQSYRGKQVFMCIKIVHFGRNPDEIEILTHTNESFAAIRKKIQNKLKLMQSVDIEFCNMGEKIDMSTVKLVSHLTFSEKLALTARLIHSNTNISSSEIELNCAKMAGYKQENNLPGVLISKNAEYYTFLFKLADIGMSMGYFPLQERCLSLLKLIPPDANMVHLVKNLCKRTVENADGNTNIEVELFSSPTKTVYLLGIIYSLLFPNNSTMLSEAQDFQKSFITSKCALRILDYLNVKSSFLAKADNFYKICAISLILKISKFVLSSLSYLKIFCLKSSTNLNEALHLVPKDFMLRKFSMNTAQSIYNIGYMKPESGLNDVLDYNPDMELISSIINIAFATATGSFEFLDSDYETLHQYFITKNKSAANKSMAVKMFDSHEVCRESIEVLTIVFMLSPNSLRDIVLHEKWHKFFIDLLLVCDEVSIRNTIMEQFTLIITKCVQSNEILNSFINLLFINLIEFLPEFRMKSGQFFQLLCNLLTWAHQSNCHIELIDRLLDYEINILTNARQKFIYSDGGLEEIQLEGHLKVTKELILLLSPEEKHQIGFNDQGHGKFIDFLMDEFIFTASKSLYLLQLKNSDIEEIDPICSTSNTLIAAYELIVSLCTSCAENLEHLSQTLEVYFSNISITEWEYFPFMGTRPFQSFVGLKNAGATCYMNSVLQQLFMIPEIRDGILSVNTGPFFFIDDNSSEEPYFNSNSPSNNDNESKTYNVGLLKQMQIIFGHLLLSKCQYYVPKGFWQHFKLFGGPINLREQHDALEFFNSLVDSLDEALKSLNQIPIMSHIFGGTFADQKICKGCPHRYSREESFTTLNVDIRNHNSLNDSLEQYVRGDLLEGDNAYHCERCNRKVDTVKRLCINKLPKVLAIQLKRFDYDYERESAIKFNDYFEFPRILDMHPYTTNGLAQMEGESIEGCASLGHVEETQFELNGIVVHSGQASGGHYYSFILHKNGTHRKWYKFDDGDVSECKLDEDEEMKTQCFGGDYVGEVFDQMLKKMSHRTQKRWWNAFILVYRKIDNESLDQQQLSPLKISMPSPIKKNVQHQNIRFLHQRNLFSEEFYYFMRRIIQCNKKTVTSNDTPNAVKILDQTKLDNIIYTTLSLASKFLFAFCFRSKRSLRNNAMDWYNDLIAYLKTSSTVRLWFLEKRMLDFPNIFCQFLLECPAPDVRLAFSKIIVLLAHYALIDKNDTSRSPSPKFLADRIMDNVLRLIRKDISDYSNNLTQYFNMFHLYAKLGIEERLHLLNFDVPNLFMLVATDEGPGYPFKYQYIEYGKLYQTVSLLVRCCDTTAKCSSFNADSLQLPNPFRHEESANCLMPIPESVYETLFIKKKYVKKIIKEANTLDDTCELLKFCCWENPEFSIITLNEILCHIVNSYTYELRPYFDLLLHILTMNDSWQDYRIRIAFEGEEQKPECLFDIMHNHTVHLEKRAYQCIKFLVNLFSSCEKALLIMKESRELRSKWKGAIEWLNDCLNFSTMSSYMHFGSNTNSSSSNSNNNSSNWSSNVPSNETSNSCSLERSDSATITLNKACEILKEDEEFQSAQELSIDEDSGEVSDPTRQLAPIICGDSNIENAEESLSKDVNNMTINRSEHEPDPDNPSTAANACTR